LNKPEARARIENRVLNGAEKFARRFENRGHWQKAAEFYQLVYESDPSRTSVLRRLVASYQALGEKQNYGHYYRILLERSMTPGAASSNNTAVNLSLARSYKKIGNKAQSDYYMQRAYQLASQAATRNPNSKEAVYDLARVQEQAGRLEDAVLHYRRCTELDPGSEVCNAGSQRVQRLLDGTDSVPATTPD
jgi:tetratricopeptide (TPR) repeat protein